MAVLSLEDCYKLARSVGASKREAILLTSFIPGESGGNTTAKNPTSGACGLWQIHPPIPGCEIPKINATVALLKLRTQGPTAWEVFTNGTYRDHTAAAERAAAKAEASGDGFDLNPFDGDGVDLNPVDDIAEGITGKAAAIWRSIAEFLREGFQRVGLAAGGFALITLGLVVLAVDAIF